MPVLMKLRDGAEAACMRLLKSCKSASLKLENAGSMRPSTCFCWAGDKLPNRGSARRPLMSAIALAPSPRVLPHQIVDGIIALLLRSINGIQRIVQPHPSVAVILDGCARQRQSCAGILIE